MSWKSFVTAGLLCVLATPAFAQPQLRIVPGGNQSNGHLNNAGNWVWLVQAKPDPSLTPNAGDAPNQTPLAVEIGLKVTAGTLVSVTAPNTGVFDKKNPGSSISDAAFTGGGTVNNNANDFAAGGFGSCGGAYNNNWCGLQANPSTGAIFASLGSRNILDSETDFQTMLVIETSGPQVGSLASTIQLLGAYSGEGLIAQVTAYNLNADNKYNASGYDNFIHAGLSQTARAGDLNLDGKVDIDDYSALLPFYDPVATGRFWYQGDFTGDTKVDIDDYSALLPNYDPVTTIPVGAGQTFTGQLVPPPGSGMSAAVPEPASVALVGLAMLGGLGLFRRNR